MRRPLDPIPIPENARLEQQADEHVGRAVFDRRLDKQSGGHLLAFGSVTDNSDGAVGRQVDRDGHVGHHVGRQSDSVDRIKVGAIKVERDVSEADIKGQEVAVIGAPFPQARVTRADLLTQLADIGTVAVTVSVQVGPPRSEGRGVADCQLGRLLGVPATVFGRSTFAFEEPTEGQQRRHQYEQ